jgi:hypothetical protein
MAETITITPNERKQLTTGDPKKAPKYTFFALNNAVKYSSANQQHTVGNITEIYKEFEEEYPVGDFQVWRNYYYNKHNGRQRLEEATDKTYDMFLTIRAAIDDIDREDVRDFVEGLVLNGTYSNQNAREAVIQKLINTRTKCESLTIEEGPEGCDLRWGNRYISIQPEEMRSETLFDREEVIVFYFSENVGDNGLKIDVSESNMTLDEF